MNHFLSNDKILAGKRRSSPPSWGLQGFCFLCAKRRQRLVRSPPSPVLSVPFAAVFAPTEQWLLILHPRCPFSRTRAWEYGGRVSSVATVVSQGEAVRDEVQQILLCRIGAWGASRSLNYWKHRCAVWLCLSIRFKLCMWTASEGALKGMGTGADRAPWPAAFRDAQRPVTLRAPHRLSMLHWWHSVAVGWASQWDG